MRQTNHHRPRLVAAFAALTLAAAACSGGSGAGSDATSPEAGAPTAPPSVAATPAPTPARPGFGGPIGQVQCDMGGHDEGYHIHSTIRIFVDGVETDPDSNIGVDQNRCMYWAHTHNGAGGEIHVEAPQDVVVTLGDFMDVWGVSFPTSPVYQAAVATLEAGGLLVDGQRPFGDWRSVVLADQLRIEVR